MKRAVGAVVLLAVLIGAAAIALPGRGASVTNEELANAVRALPGVAEAIDFEFDNRDFSGQTGARVVGIDFVLKGEARRDTILKSMKAMGSIATESVVVYQRVAVTGYRSRAEFDAGLPFAARAVWLAREIAKPLEGWMVMRLPDEVLPPEKALSGIYSKPSVDSTGDGALVATLDLDSERLARPTADIKEILAAPLLDCYDYDNVFLRSPALKSVDITIMQGGRRAAHLAMTREALAATNVVALRADLSSKVLAISGKEVAYAQKYDESGLFTPLLFDSVVSKEDKAALKAIEDERRAVEEAFYRGLFAAGSVEVLDLPTVPLTSIGSTQTNTER